MPVVAPHRSVSIDVLYNNALTVWPGMTIFWIGDYQHTQEISGHNPDDTPGVQAEQTDADNDPEVRALDFMIGPKFTASDAQALTHALVTGVDRNRLYYVIYNHLIYKRSNNYEPTAYTGIDPHTDHVHASGRAVDDDNSANWKSVLALLPQEQYEGETMRFMFADDLDGITELASGRVHVSDGLRYRIMQKGAAWNALMNSAGAGPIIQVNAANTGGASYATAVATLCGTMDPGELEGSGGGSATLIPHTHGAVTSVGETGDAVPSP